MYKILVVLIDGLGDASYSELGGKTPLMCARTPFMDLVALHGINGLLDPVGAALACGSDTAHLSLLGYDPAKYYRGRGSFECLGAGIDMDPGSIGFKCNFAHWDPQTSLVVHRRVDRNFKEGPELCRYLDEMAVPGHESYRVRVQYATEHRCGITIQGPGLSMNITGTDPLKDNLPLIVCQPLDTTSEARLTSELVNRLSCEINRQLESHPLNLERKRLGKPTANVVLLRGCGQMLDCPSFASLHGFEGCMVAPTCIISGLGKSLGLKVLEALNATGDYQSDFMSKAKVLVEALSSLKYEFGFMHIKAVDDAGHDRDPMLKRDLIERVDQAVGHIQKLAGETSQHIVLCITGDHSTVCTLGDHSTEPVPFAVCHIPFPEELCGDDVDKFDEVSVCRGWLGRFPGSEVMGILKAMKNKHG